MASAPDAPRPGRLRKALALVPWLVGGAVLGYSWGRFELPRPGLWGLGAWHLLLVPVALYLSVLMHEAGHFIAGRLVGLQWHTVAVGPLRVTRRHQGISVDWFRNRGPIGGLVVMFPPRHGLRPAGWVVYALGGPVANVLVALAVAWLIHAYDPGGWQGPLIVLAAVSLVLGLVNLVPFRAAGMNTDGRNVLNMLANPPSFAAGQLVMSIIAESLSGVRPRDWNPVLVEQLEGMDDPSDEIAPSREFLLYLKALDSGDMQTARRHLAGVEATFDRVPDLLAPPIACALSIHHALVEPAPDAAREWHARGAHGLGDATLSAMADLGLAVLEERWADASDLAQRARKAMLADADQGGIQPYRDILERQALGEADPHAVPQH